MLNVRRNNALVVPLVIALVFSSAGAGWCALNSYLYLEVRDEVSIEGECTQEGHENWITVYGVEHTIEIPMDQYTGLATGQRFHRPLTIIKAVDSSSPLICQALCTGKVMKTFVLDFYRINEKGQEEFYYQITLENATVVNYKLKKPVTFLDAMKPFHDMEEVTFSYDKITWSHKIANKGTSDTWKKPVGY